MSTVGFNRKGLLMLLATEAVYREAKRFAYNNEYPGTPIIRVLDKVRTEELKNGRENDKQTQ